MRLSCAENVEKGGGGGVLGLELWVCMFLKGPSITMMGWKEVSEGILCKYANYTWITKTYWIMYIHISIYVQFKLDYLYLLKFIFYNKR